MAKNNRQASMHSPQQPNLSASRKRKVFVVDDHPIVRQGLALMINAEDDLTVCGAAEEAQTALPAIAETRPDLLIIDISLNGPDGLELVKHVRVLFPELPILVLSMHDETTYAERALRARANGYIMKQEATEKVLGAIRRIVKGDVYLSEEAASKMLKQYVRGTTTPEHSPVEELSDRELEVFRLVGAGR